MQFPLKQPFQLLPLFRERVWGRESLAPYFPGVRYANRIGEAWFSFEENQTSLGATLGEVIAAHPAILGTSSNHEHPAICPLLIKLLFTTERLSVQVHPGDEYARHHHNCLGKTEAWYVIDAEPGGEIAVGFRKSLTPSQLRASALNGEIENLLDWRKVSAGDVILTPAGTVHAIGAGVTICEIQQNSDITYRLYDYGRPRELHLDHGVQVSHLGPSNHHQEKVILSGGREQLAACEYFRIERLRPVNAITIAGGLPHYLLLVSIKGSGNIAGLAYAPGQTWMAPARAAEFTISGADSEWLLTYAANEPLDAVRLT
ncbi:MAG TPA: class I mannose-6-phosphate isomerase [Bryobacteraceae bacterium]|jgi:mannose-6-phosphate isomerase